MVADRILVLGFDDASRPSLKTSSDTVVVPPIAVLLSKLGYEAVELPKEQKIFDFVSSQILDGILIDSNFCDGTLSEMIDFFRATDSTRTIPIIAAVDRPKELQNIKEKRLPRVELLPKPVSVGILAGRLATNLRVRKLDGSDKTRASVGDINANLRDVNQRFAHEREEAKKIQEALLPRLIPKSDNFEVAVAYKPLDDVGGDWYNFDLSESGNITLQVADITGHGISAAFICSMTKLALLAADSSTPGSLLSGMNRLMSAVLPEGRLVTMASLEYNPRTRKLLVSYGGHPAVIVVRTNAKTTEELKGQGFPLGFEETFVYPNKEAQLESGDVVIAYTDGLSEALNRSNEMFASARIGQSVLAAGENASAQVIVNRLLADFDEFREGRILKDDVTVVALKIKS
jgi:sigma-B regulation protein RsbU (phosphoserine phosphatase)